MIDIISEPQAAKWSYSDGRWDVKVFCIIFSYCCIIAVVMYTDLASLETAMSIHVARFIGENFTCLPPTIFSYSSSSVSAWKGVPLNTQDPYISLDWSVSMRTDSGVWCGSVNHWRGQKINRVAKSNEPSVLGKSTFEKYQTVFESIDFTILYAHRHLQLSAFLNCQ